MRTLAACAVLVGGLVGALPVSGAVGQEATDERRTTIHKWHRSHVTRDGHTVRIAIVTGRGDRIAPHAYVRRTPSTVRIKLVKTVPTGDEMIPADALLWCVEVRLPFAATRLVRVDGATGRAPDRAAPGTRDAAAREDTRSVDLVNGPCKRLKTRRLPSWTRR